MKNILFVGPYKQSDGWGNASREYIRALAHTGHKLTTRPIYINAQTNFEKFPEFDKFESNKFDHYDIIIQNCLPEMFRNYGGVKNIGIAFFESTIKHTPWPRSINLLDEMWVSSEFEKNIVSSACSTPVKVIPIPSDIEKFDKDIKYNNILKDHNHEFKFYFIGEFIERKNIESIIKAFHIEFKTYEQARLVIKTNIVGIDESSALRSARAKIDKIKMDLGLHKTIEDYKSEILITSYLPEDELIGIHKECDCFIMPSSGEGFCMPAFDALGFGSAIITNKNSSVAEYVTNNLNGYLVDSYKSPAIASDRTLDYIYTGKDYWYEVDLLGLQKAMRYAFNLNQHPNKKKDRAIDNKLTLNKYSYSVVANNINDIL